MITVYKYPVVLNDEFTLGLPGKARVLTVQVQRGKPYLWALVDTEEPSRLRHFRLAGTGHPINEPISEYLGTFQVEGGLLVFHLFEMADVIEPREVIADAEELSDGRGLTPP
jgi:hypothetical protein